MTTNEQATEDEATRIARRICELYAAWTQLPDECSGLHFMFGRKGDDVVPPWRLIVPWARETIDATTVVAALQVAHNDLLAKIAESSRESDETARRLRALVEGAAKT